MLKYECFPLYWIPTFADYLYWKYEGWTIIPTRHSTGTLYIRAKKGK